MSSFSLNQKEQASEALFKLDHKGHGPDFEYTFIPTGVGIKVRIKCKGCGKSKDITDYSTW